MGELPKHLALARQLRLQLLILTAQGVVVLRQPLFVFLQLLDDGAQRLVLPPSLRKGRVLGARRGAVC